MNTNQAFVFLISNLFNLFLMVVILRFWLQLAKADFYNPLSQFIVKVTSPLVNPLRKIVPGFGGLDIASILLALLVGIIKVAVLTALFSNNWDTLSVIILGLISVLKEAVFLVYCILILRAILSWVSQGHNPMEAVLHQLTEPMLRPIRRIIPPIGGLDLSILVLILIITFFQQLFPAFI